MHNALCVSWEGWTSDREHRVPSRISNGLRSLSPRFSPRSLTLSFLYYSLENIIIFTAKFTALAFCVAWEQMKCSFLASLSHSQSVSFHPLPPLSNFFLIFLLYFSFNDLFLQEYLTSVLTQSQVSLQRNSCQLFLFWTDSIISKVGYFAFMFGCVCFYDTGYFVLFFWNCQMNASLTNTSPWAEMPLPCILLKLWWHLQP